MWVAEPLRSDPGPLLALLDPAERARAASLPAEQAARFVLARALLREVLGERLGCPAQAVLLRVRCPVCGGPHGRIEVARPGDLDASPRGDLVPSPRGDLEPSPPHVSVTRAGPLIAVAVTGAGPVGVDVESHAAVAAGPFADVALSRGELAAYRRLRPGGRTAALARAWVRKEAALKALGTGLRTDPGRLELGGPAGGPGDRHAVLGVLGDTRLVVATLGLGPGVSGAVAVAWDGSGQRGLGTRAGRPRLDVQVHDGASGLAGLVDR